MLKGVISHGKGKLTGKVCMVEDPVNGQFNTGDIMVTTITYPQSIEKMKRASAVITDRGTRLSHAYIVCRDNNIPCVIGTSFATKELKTGDNIEIDFETMEIKVI